MFLNLSKFQLSLAFIALLVLRLVVGFHFYKEGVGKLNDSDWTAEGFLQTAKGPFAEQFRSMTDDPDGTRQLGIVKTLGDDGETSIEISTEETFAIWDDFVDRATDYYAFGSPQLIESLESKIAKLESSIETDVAEDADKTKQLVETLRSQIEAISKQPQFANEILAAHELELQDWINANRVTLMAHYRTGDRLVGFERDGENKSQVAMKVDSLRGQIDTIASDRYKELAKWKSEVSEVWDSFEMQINSIAVGDQVRDASLPLDRPYAQQNSKLSVINKVIPWFDTIVGVLLILGLFTRFASLAAALFLCSVLLTQPFWIPGTVPTYYQAIEMAACLVLFATCAGRIGGLDFFFSPTKTVPPSPPSVAS